MKCTCIKHRFDSATLKGKRHPRRLPKQHPPIRIEEQYAKALLRVVVGSVRKAYAKLIAEGKALAQAKHEEKYPKAVRTDSPESRKVQGLIADAAQDLRGRTNKPQIAALAKRFAQQTQTFQRVQLNNQVSDVLGVDVPERDPEVADRMSDFVRQNVDLVSSIPQDLHGELGSLVHHAVVQGRPSRDLSNDIEKRFGVAESRARLIARDQIGKLYADINRHRQRRLGIQKFIWRTMKDERVRGDPDGKYPNATPSHFDLEGLMFSYDDPPTPEGADGPLLPGEDYQCRCYAEPVLDDLLADDDDEPDDEGDDDEGDEPDDGPEDIADDDPGDEATQDDIDDTEGDDLDDDE